MSSPAARRVFRWKTLTAGLLLSGVLTTQAGSNVLGPLAGSSARAGDQVAHPWMSSDGTDDQLVHVRLGSPDGGKANWVEFKDESPINTANLRLTGLDPIPRGEFSFEILMKEGSQGVATVSLGLDGVTERATRVISVRFDPDGTIRVSTHDEMHDTTGRLEPGVAQTIRAKFKVDDKDGASIQLFAGDSAEPMGEIKTPDPLVPITGVRVTSTQKGTNTNFFVRNISLVGE